MRSILLETGDYLRSVVGLNNDIILVSVLAIMLDLNTLFQQSEGPLLSAIKRTLDERYTPQMEVIYTVIVKFMINTMVE